MAPDTPTVSAVTNPSDYTALNITWGTASYGTPSTGTSYIYRGTSASPTFLMYSKTAVGTILWTNTGCTPNTRYYYRARAKNDGDLWSSYSADSDAVTLARPANVSIADTTDTSITVSYSTYADGGEYDKDIQYSIDSGTTWVTGATVTGGSVATGTFTISGLTAHTSYTIRTRVSTTAGTSNGSTLSAIATNAKLYGSVNSETKRTKKLYGSLELLQSFTATGQSTAGSVSGFFYPVTFVPKLLATNSNLLVKGLVDFSTCKIKMVRQAITGNTSVSYYDSTTDPVTEIPIVSGTPSVVETYGIHLAGAGTIEYTVTDDVYAPVTKKIKKLYGSVDTIHNVELKGDTYQYTTTGKNLMPITSGTISESGITITVADGIVTINGTSTSAGVIKLSNGLASAASIPSSWYNESVVADRNGKTFSIVKTSGTGPASATAFRIYRDNSNFEQWYPSVGGTQSFTDNYPILFLELFFNSGVTFTDAVYEIQLETGSKTAFEPYTAGPSPNPSYPQDIDVVTGDQTITVTGKNILYIPNSSISINNIELTTNNGVLAIKNTGTFTFGDASFGVDNVLRKTNYASYVSWGNTTLRAGTYSLSFYKISGTTSTDGTTSYLRAGIWSRPVGDTDRVKTAVGYTSMDSGDSHLTFTLAEDAEVNIVVYLHGANSTVDVTFNLQLEIGSATAYEPYKGQSYEVNLGGKNLFNATIEQGTILGADGTNSPADNRVRTAGFITAQPQTTYTVSANAGSTLGMALAFCYKEDGTYIDRTASAFQACPYTFTTLANTAKIRLAFTKNPQANLTPSDLSKVQLEEGSTLGPYAPYTTQVIELAKIGTYQDYIWKDGADWKVHKETQKKVLDGSESWSLFSTAASELRYSFSTSLSGKKFSSDVTNVACDTFKVLNSSGSTAGDAEKYTCRGTTYNTVFYLMTPRTTISGETSEEIVANFKVWLASHVTTVYYQLATATDTAITDATLISQLNALEGAVSPSKNPNVFVAGSLPATAIFDVDGATKLIYEG